MKTLMNLKRAFLFAALPFVVGGCVKSSDPDFSVNCSGYILQENTVIGEGQVESRFAPYVAVTSAYYGDVINKVTFGKDGNTYKMRKINDYLFESGLRFSETIPNGTYSITAQSSEGEVYSTAVNLKGEKKLGVLNVKEFKYQLGTGVTASWDPVEGENVQYGLMFSVKVTDPYGVATFYRANNQYVRWQNDMGGGSLTEGNFNFMGQFSIPDGTEVQVAVIALSQNIILEGPVKVIKIGTSGFVGEMPQPPSVQ